MDIKPIPGMQPYQINTASEAVDEERRRENQRAKKGKDRDANDSAKTTSSSATSETPPPEIRQIVDSEKIVELLARRDENASKPKNAFSSVQSKTKPARQNSDTKRINRSF